MSRATWRRVDGQLVAHYGNAGSLSWVEVRTSLTCRRPYRILWTYDLAIAQAKLPRLFASEPRVLCRVVH